MSGWGKAGIGVAVAVLLAAGVVSLLGGVITVRGSSMRPALRNGQKILVERVLYRLQLEPLQRGDIIVFPYPADPKVLLVKRIIGLPGDMVAIRDGLVYLNGEPLYEPYVAGRMLGDYGPCQVPVGKVFVLGDNRNDSIDSRDPDVGCVSVRKVVGRAVLRIWPVRWFPVIRRPPALGSGP